MTNINSEEKIPENLKRYLYSEMTLEDTEKFQEKLFTDDELFQDVVDLENSLVDNYVKGKLLSKENLWFKRSLKDNPERQEKVANALVLQNFIEKNKQLTNTSGDEKTLELTFWQKISAFFTMPKFSFAMSAAFILVTLFSIFLLLDNRRKSDELTNLQNQGQDGNSIRQQRELEEKFEKSRRAENQLQTRIDDEREATGELADELVRERQIREKLQKDLAVLRKQNQIILPNVIPTPIQQTPPRVASIRLTPDKNPDKSRNDLNTARIGDRTSRVAVNLSLPAETPENERFSLNLNDKPYLENVAPRISADGKKNISLTIETVNFNNGKNKLSVIDKEGKLITNYVFEVNKQ